MTCESCFLLLGAALGTLAPLHAQTQWAVVWSDEFDGPANSAPDPAKWTYDLGGGGWGNGESEVYTDSRSNSYLDGQGNLAIKAIRAADGSFTSARLKTQGLYQVQYGKIEARIKLPYGQGIWPAFWMLGVDIGSVGWPQCGEVDIMENIGREPSMNHGSTHGPGNDATAAFTLAGGQKLSDDFHLFSIIWEKDSVEFFVDGNSYEKVTPATLPAGTSWVFNNPFFFIVNMAVGGQWPGSPDATTVFPQTMLVDYIRVSQAVAPKPAIAAGGVVNAASFSPALAPGALATVFGSNLADAASGDLFDSSAGEFRTFWQGSKVYVNGEQAPMTYLGPAQINFQIPWDAPVGVPVAVQVFRNDIASGRETITLAETAPSAFSSGNVAILTCMNGSPPKAGLPCTLWGNGFGQTTPSPQHSGVPAASPPLPKTSAACKLELAGAGEVVVSYCGAAPGLVIDQLNFVYPANATGNPNVAATLTAGGASASIVLPTAQ